MMLSRSVDSVFPLCSGGGLLADDGLNLLESYWIHGRRGRRRLRFHQWAVVIPVFSVLRQMSGEDCMNVYMGILQNVLP